MRREERTTKAAWWFWATSTVASHNTSSQYLSPWTSRQTSGSVWCHSSLVYDMSNAQVYGMHKAGDSPCCPATIRSNEGKIYGGSIYVQPIYAYLDRWEWLWPKKQHQEIWRARERWFGTTPPIIVWSRVSLLARHLKVTGYSCARRPKCIGKCILKLANQKSRVRRAWATWFWRWRCVVTRCRAWRKLFLIA